MMIVFCSEIYRETFRVRSLIIACLQGDAFQFIGCVNRWVFVNKRSEAKVGGRSSEEPS